MSYIPAIGLEIHAELKTRTKMFCNSKNDSDEKRPNVNICPVCLAHPGVLPVINREAVKHVLRVGVALGGTLADYTEFDRKNYFYPDLPKGYQISQFAYPLVSGGSLLGVAITRVHLEEDTASSIHEEGATVIDFNRSGIPLMELVTEPVIKSAEEACRFARELQLMLRYLNVSEANMEKGEMRVEANVSVSRSDTQSKRYKGASLGTKVEIKNLNSFRAVERAITYEIERQATILKRGESVVQETRGWDENTQKTFIQRVKEGSADYRYFPDPDLPSLKMSLLSEFGIGLLEDTIPELPWSRRNRYIKLGIKPDDAEMFVRDTKLGDFFESIISLYPPQSREVMLASNYVANDLVNIIRQRGGYNGDIRDIQEQDTEIQSEIPISAGHFKKIIDMLSSGKISSRSAKDLLAFAIASGEDPEDIARKRALFKAESVQLELVVIDIIEANPGVVGDFQGGKKAALEYLVGQCMKNLRGAADPVILRRILQDRISKQGEHSL